MNYSVWHMKNTFITNFLVRKMTVLLGVGSRLVAVDTLLLLHPAPPQHVDVFGSLPAVSGQRRLSQAQREQPEDRVTVNFFPFNLHTAEVHIFGFIVKLFHHLSQ